MSELSASKRSIMQMNTFERDAPAGGLLARRVANAGAMSILFYREPLQIVSAQGAWMQAADGTRYLDLYNNVPSVGHCHPRVVEAVSAQLGVLNINTRYLNEGVERYVESLKARLPVALDNVVMTCSGSEANDLAMRVAERVTGHSGYIVSENAYHGNTRAVTEISPASLPVADLPDHVIGVPAPGRRNYGDDVAGGFAAAVIAAARTLDERGHGLSALVCDSVFSSDGVFTDPGGFLAPAVDAARAHGGLYIADEVQPGFARTGAGFWGYAMHGVTPDMITLGKPMGNGYPMAALAAPAAHLELFCADVGYFNTFGGSPVAAAAGQAVLDVIEQEGLLERAATVGAHLAERVRHAATLSSAIAEVRGRGLFMGIEIGQQGDPARPDGVAAARVIDGLRTRGVLIGAAGTYGNTLKVRPPLCLSLEEADRFADALEAELASLQESGRADG